MLVELYVEYKDGLAVCRMIPQRYWFVCVEYLLSSILIIVLRGLLFIYKFDPK